MAERAQKKAGSGKYKGRVPQEMHKPTRAESHKAAERKADTEKLKQDLDEMLDEIDDVLNDEEFSNAEEFVNSYRQKGGE